MRDRLVLGNMSVAPEGGIDTRAQLALELGSQGDTSHSMPYTVTQNHKDKNSCRLIYSSILFQLISLSQKSFWSTRFMERLQKQNVLKWPNFS